MSKLAIVFCAVLFASAANGADRQEVEIAKAHAEQEFADALFIADRRNLASEIWGPFDSKTQLLATILWHDITEYLEKENIDQDAKDELKAVIDEVDDIIQEILKSVKDSLELCPEKESEALIIDCYYSNGLAAIAAPMQFVSKLIGSVDEVSKLGCNKK